MVGTDIREDSRRYTVFVLEARLGERVWTVEKRFQDFCRFDAQLRRELAATRQMVDGVVPPLPRRVPAIAIDNALRAQQLDLYCKTLCVHVAAAQAVRAHGMTRGRHVINDSRSNCEEVEQAVLMVLVHNLYAFVDFKQQCGVSSPGPCHGMAQEHHAAVDPPGAVGSLDRQTLDITHDLPHSSAHAPIDDVSRAEQANSRMLQVGLASGVKVFGKEVEERMCEGGMDDEALPLSEDVIGGHPHVPGGMEVWVEDHRLGGGQVVYEVAVRMRGLHWIVDRTWKQIAALRAALVAAAEYDGGQARLPVLPQESAVTVALALVAGAQVCDLMSCHAYAWS